MNIFLSIKKRKKRDRTISTVGKLTSQILHEKLCSYYMSIHEESIFLIVSVLLRHTFDVINQTALFSFMQCRSIFCPHLVLLAS